MVTKLLTLGVETSCDDTAVCVLESRFKPLSSVIASQNNVHAVFGGVVPELACRRHVEVIRPVMRTALARAGVGLDDIRLVAATSGPGLVGALLVGLSYAKALAHGLNLPFVAVNHLQGHIMSAFIERPDVALPAVALLVSGGHTELFLVSAPTCQERLGGTRDDSAGEALDKVGRLLGLDFPGGPAIEKAAMNGKAIYDFPVAMANSNSLEFSFSGPKTAVKYTWRGLGAEEKKSGLNDICASFQRAVVAALSLKTRRAVEKFKPRSLFLVGGVARNTALRKAFTQIGDQSGVEVVIPAPELCSDNAVMIAGAGANRYLDNPDDPAWADYLAIDADPSCMP